MAGEKDFVQSLANFLALHTEQSSAYLRELIQMFLHGSAGRSIPEPPPKDEIMRQIVADMEGHKDVPSFLQNYLHSYLTEAVWPPQVAFLASLYLRRRSSERFLTWPQRLRSIAQLDAELTRGTELGLRQLLYSQGAGPVFRWRGVPCFKTVYDLAIYAMLVDELRPATIIELGSGAGGSALFFADLSTASGLTTQIISIDTGSADVQDPRIGFIQSDCLAWLRTTAESKAELPRPILMIEDFHGDLAGFFHHVDSILDADDYFVVEDSSGKQNRIAQVIANRPYLVDAKYTDFFGINCTSAVNSIFVKDSIASATKPRAQQERQLLRDQDRAWRQRTKRET